MKKINLKSGYSLIEIIIYIAVFAVITVVIANAFIVLVSFFNQSRTNHDLLQNGNTALERMSREIRIATAVKGTSVLNTTPGSLELDSLDSNGAAQVIKFDVTDGALNISKNGTVVGNLLGPNIKVTSLIFRNVATTNSKVIKIEMTIQDTRDRSAINENFYNIVVLPKEVSGSGGGSGGSSSAVEFPTGIKGGTGGVIIGTSSYTGNLYSYGNVPCVDWGQPCNVTGSIFVNGATNYVGSLYPSSSILNVNGNISAHTVNYAAATGTIYCQSGSNNNKACDTSQADPTVSDIPDLGTQTNAWKAEAEAGGVINGNVDVNAWQQTMTLGPKKIVGNLTVVNGNTLILTGPVWVTGQISINGVGTKIKLDSSYGSGDGVIISGNLIYIYGGATVEGSGSADSYILFISTYSGAPAIMLYNATGNGVYFAKVGEAWFSNGSVIKGAMAKTIQIYNGGQALTATGGPTSLNIGKGIFSVTP